MTDHNLDIPARLDFMLVDQETRDTLVEMSDEVFEVLPEALNKFYSHVTNIPSLTAIVGDLGRIPKLKELQTSHWAGLFSGRFDSTYFDRAVIIGQAHDRIGLEPRWYIGGYNLILNELVSALAQSNRKKPEVFERKVRALIKAALIDCEVAISTYIQSANDKSRKGILEVADLLEAEVSAVVANVDAKSREATQASVEMSNLMANVLERSSNVAAGAEEATTNVNATAASADELSVTVNEVSAQVQAAQEVSQRAVRESSSTQTTIGELATAANKINDVVELISDIASQTNLLALNATIEAARAGEAGKGFAVVASEVKTLANQTSNATEDITRQVNEMHNATSQAVEAIGRINAVIGEIESISSAIASAVEEQSIATAEIAQNVTEAAGGTSEVAANIVEVRSQVDQAASISQEVNASSQDMQVASEELNQKVAELLKRLRGEQAA